IPQRMLICRRPRTNTPAAKPQITTTESDQSPAPGRSGGIGVGVGVGVSVGEGVEVWVMVGVAEGRGVGETLSIATVPEDEISSRSSLELCAGSATTRISSTPEFGTRKEALATP